MSAKIIILADARRLRERRRDPLREAAEELFALQMDLVTIGMQTLTTASLMATAPLWPNGIDDLEWS